MSKILLDILNDSTSSVSQMRSSIFLPYSNIESTNIYKTFVKNKNKGLFFENEEFKLNIRNRLLGQSHRDFLDVIFSEGLLKMTTKGQYYAEFTLYAILKKLGKSQCGKNRTWLKEKIQDLVDVVISLERLNDSTNSWSDIHILDQAKYSDKQKRFIIAFNSEYINSFLNDTVINYDNYLPSILAIKNDTIKAFIRYVLPNDFKNAQLDFILNQLDISEDTMTKRQFNKIKKKVRDYNYSEFGITIRETEQVMYHKQVDIMFLDVKKKIQKVLSASQSVTQEIVIQKQLPANNTMIEDSIFKPY